MTTPNREWTDEQLLSDAVSKKDIVTFLHENATHDFLVEFKLTGKLATVVKNAKKDSLVQAYNSLFTREAFRGADEPSEEEIMAAKNAAPVAAKVEAVVETGPPKFTKTVLKKGDKIGYPKKGSSVAVFYTGYFEDGTIFDTNDNTKKKSNPLRFKVGSGNVIAGWDDAMLSMSRGEKAKITIEAEHAYGKKGVPEGKVPIPPNTRLIFDVELVSIN